MQPGARIQASIDLLAAILSASRPADGVASQYFRERRYIGSKDRRAVADKVWGVIRRRSRLEWWITRLAEQAPSRSGRAPSLDLLNRDKTHGRLLIVADLCLTDRMNPEAVDRLFSGGKFAPLRLTDAEKTFVKGFKGRTLIHPDMPLPVQAEVPDWVADKLAPVFGDDLYEELAALNEEAPLDLRANGLKASRDEALKRLKQERINAAPTPMSPVGLRVAGRVNLAAGKTFKDGLVEVQDEGSQLLALLVGARKGQQVLDFCAGAGGKTLAMAATMQNKGKITACDISAGRLDRSGVRFKRAGAHNIITRSIADERDRWFKRKGSSFDRVLVDAPCSGVGAWRRNPDGKDRMTREGLRDLTQRQGRILASAARLVKAGGRLVYATCSLLPEENEEQVRRFLDKHKDYRLLPLPKVWAEVMGADGSPCPTEAETLTLTPRQHGADGFFCAVMERLHGKEAKAKQTPEPQPDNTPEP